MPNYAYRCGDCGRSFHEDRTVEHRHTTTCSCGATADKVFEPCSNIITYGTYHDFALGVDITGPGHRRAVMKAMQVEERGSMSIDDATKEIRRVNDVPKKKEVPADFLETFNKVRAMSDSGTLPPATERK